MAGNIFGDGWLLGSGTSTNHTSLGLYRIRVSASARYDDVTGQSLGVTFERLADFSPGEIEAGATGFYGAAGALCYDATDDGVILQVRMSNGGAAGTIYTFKWRADVGIVWKTAVSHQINYEGPFFGQSRLDDDAQGRASSPSAADLPGCSGRPDPAQPAAPEPPPDPVTVRTEALVYARAVVDLCKVAGQPQMAAGFLADETSLEQVRETLIDARAEAEPEISASHTRPGPGPEARPWGDVIARTFKRKG